MKTVVSALALAIALAVLTLAGAESFGQETPQAAAERCKDIEQQGPNKGQNAMPSSAVPQQGAGTATLNSIATGSGDMPKPAPRSSDNAAPGSQDCVIYAAPSDKPKQ